MKSYFDPHSRAQVAKWMLPGVAAAPTARGSMPASTACTRTPRAWSSA